MESILGFVDFFIHIDKHLDLLLTQYGNWSYLVLFIIVFCETGLVITPILPGDSLLFAAGAIAARGSINVHILALLLFIAAVVGDAVNYMIGNIIGPKVFEKRDSKIFKQAYLLRTQQFYEKYGGKTIIIARFVPIVRTFAPFLAGVGSMSYAKFASYNIIGAALWVGLVTYAGYIFGEFQIVKDNFGLVVLGIIIVSILPAAFEYIRIKREGNYNKFQNSLPK